jgi:signal transduction histidine kinase
MRSIRRQMALAVGVASGLVVLCGGFGIYLTLRIALRNQFDASLRTKAEALVIASDVDLEEEEFEIDFDVQSFAGFGSSSPGDYFEVRTREGEIVESSPSLSSGVLPTPRGFDDEPEGFAGILLPENVEGRAYWRTFTPADDEEHRFTDLRILVASDLTRLRRTLRVVAVTIAAFGLGGLAAILVLLRFVVGSGLAPLDRLAADVQRIDVARLAGRLDTADLPSELGGVGEKLNELLARLEASFARERRFSSHAAHELRTPLAELKAMTELVATWPEELTPEHSAEMLEVIGELEELIEKLALLARAEGGSAAAFEPLEIGAVIESCVERRRAEIEARRLSVDLRVKPGDFRCDPVLFRAVANNLIDNATAYAPEGSAIEIEASPRSLVVRNEAPELGPEDVERLFERFWRKEVARPDGRHSGLGLSIVRSSAEFLGGSCRASLEGGRLSIEILWPA